MIAKVTLRALHFLRIRNNLLHVIHGSKLFVKDVDNMFKIGS